MKIELSINGIVDKSVEVTKLKGLLYFVGFILYIASYLVQASAFPEEKNVSTGSRNALLSFPETSLLANVDWLAHYFDSSTVDDAIAFIATAESHGLNPEDYQLPTLQTYATQSTNAADNAHLYRLLSSRLALFIHDLKNGRYSPAIVDPAWHIPAQHFDAHEFLIHALQSKNLQSHLKLIEPTSNDYKLLTEALKNYRLLAQQNDWPQIPATPLLRPGDNHPAIVIIQSRLAAEDKLIALSHRVQSDFYDPLMEQAVMRFQARHGLKVDGVIGPQTREAMNVSAKQRVEQIKINLERYRWLPDDFGERYIYINLPSFKLKAFEQGQQILDMKVIVGRKSRQTPSFFSELEHMVFNPYWSVPKKLARLDLLPKQQQDPNYFIDNNIKVFSVDGSRKVEQDPRTIDWQSYSEYRTLPYTLRQEPGQRNALGKIKFLFKNPWSIYLHDTPNKSLFNDENRAFSSGCIRVEDPIGLANFTLNQPHQQHIIKQNLDSEQNRGLKIQQPVNIFVAYFTVSVEDNQVLFSQDIYQRDQRMIKILY